MVILTCTTQSDEREWCGTHVPQTGWYLKHDYVVEMITTGALTPYAAYDSWDAESKIVVGGHAYAHITVRMAACRTSSV